MKCIIWGAFLSLFFFTNAYTQTPIDEANAAYRAGSTTSYTEGGDTYNYGDVPSGESGNDLVISSFEIDAETFEITRFADRINILRVDNVDIDTEKQLLFFEDAGSSGTTINLRPSFLNTMEEALLNEGINRGTDNVFANDGGTNTNNIERIDFIFEGGITVPSDPSTDGFTLLERGGNDDFKIAAITGLDANGDPDGFGEIISIDRTEDWGGTQWSFATEVLASDTPSDNLVRTASVGSQTINGVFVSYDVLGFSAGDEIFGYSIAGGDVSDTPSDWLDPAAKFPTTTDAGSDGAGGLDLIAGGSVSSSNTERSVTLKTGPCWRTLTSPVAGQTYQEFFEAFDTPGGNGLWTQGTTGARDENGDPNVLTLNGDGDDWIAVPDLTQPIPPGTGFLMSVFEDDDGINTTGSFNKTASFTGVQNSAGFTVELSTTPGTGSGTSGSGFSILGNPFKSDLDFNKLETDQITESIWIYDRNAASTTNGNQGGWVSYNASTNAGDITDGIISPFQGFVVQKTDPVSGTPSVTFPIASLSGDTGAPFFGKETSKPDFVRLELSGENLYNSMWLAFSNMGSFDENRGDAMQLMPFESEFATLSSRKNDDILMDIGHFPFLVGEEKIPVHANVTRPGNYTIRVTDTELSPGNVLYLIDLETNESVRIEKDIEYTFKKEGNSTSAKDSVNNCLATPQKAKVESNNRFIIASSQLQSTQINDLPDSYRLQQNYPNPFNPTTQITYELPQNSDVRLEVFDMNGRQVATLVNESVSAGTHTVNFDATNLSSGVYIYKLQAGSTVLSRKLTLIK